MNDIQIRENLPSILHIDSIGCELGVFEGEYAQILADSGKFKKLYLVDIFSGGTGSGDKSGNNLKFYQDGSLLFEHNKQKFSAYDFIEVIRQDSISFLNAHKDFFDFVYIDTVHTYDFTLRELEAAYTATKVGGFICGHDYHPTKSAGVVRAVQEFVAKYSLKYDLTSQDILESFVIQKL